jgi:hypothetical protein
MGIVVINTIVQSFLQPTMLGKGLNLAPVVVIFPCSSGDGALAQPAALMAVPLTMAVKEIFLDAYDDTRDLARLMDDPTAIAKQSSDTPANWERYMKIHNGVQGMTRWQHDDHDIMRLYTRT